MYYFVRTQNPRPTFHLDVEGRLMCLDCSGAYGLDSVRHSLGAVLGDESRAKLRLVPVRGVTDDFEYQSPPQGMSNA